PHHIGKPHQQSGDQEQYAAHDDGPEIKLLPAIEKSDVLGFDPFIIGSILANPLRPTSIRFSPCHRSHPIEELKKEKDLEQQTKPRMKKARSWATTEERRDPVEQPRRVD